ncbi:MAG: transcriptional repressor [Patescibacteria group bacterium]
MTHQRDHLFHVLLKSSHPLSIEQLIPLVDSHFVSVYRNVQELRKVGVIKQVPLGLKYSYELSDMFKPHHHHISCDGCSAVSGIDDEEIERLIDSAAVRAGYRPTGHSLEMRGICRNCRVTD